MSKQTRLVLGDLRPLQRQILAGFQCQISAACDGDVFPQDIDVAVTADGQQSVSHLEGPRLCRDEFEQRARLSHQRFPRDDDRIISDRKLRVPLTRERKILRGFEKYIFPDLHHQIPSDLLDQVDRQFGERRSFSYQVPHFDDARKLFYRPQALSYESTRFEEYWQPDQDLLTELLTRAVEKTTKEIRIPVPGNPKETLVCRVSLLAMGGGCGIEVNGSDYTGPKDDPNTLSPEEDRQCQAWWERIVGARTQDEWRATRKLYEQECRKPLGRIQR